MVSADSIRTLGRLLLLPLSLSLLLLLGCGAEESASAVNGAPVRGARLDGTEDRVGESAARRTGERAGVELNETGVTGITFRDLSLEDFDVDALLDAVLFPEEYEAEELEALALPERITRYDGREVSIVGYMIPGELEGNEARDFMLVRDLMSCCFGGSPNADEWIDVVMVEGETAVYYPFLKTRVEGRMTLGGELDDAGFAVGIFHLEASRSSLEE